MITTVKISDDNLETLNRYSEIVRDTYKIGDMSKRQREEARSYASEFLSRFLNDNPDLFPHANLIQEIYNDRLKQL